MKTVIGTFLKVCCVCAALLPSVSYGWIDLMKVWKGEVRLWDMSPREVRKQVVSESVLSIPDDSSITVNTSSYFGSFTSDSSYNQLISLWYWKGEKDPSDKRKKAWVELWRGNDSVDKVRSLVGQFTGAEDELGDMRPVKITMILGADKLSLLESESRSRKTYTNDSKNSDNSQNSDSRNRETPLTPQQIAAEEKQNMRIVESCAKKITESTGVVGKAIKTTRPADAAGREYSGILWKGENCVLLLEKVFIRKRLEYVMFTYAKDEAGLKYMTPTEVQKEPSLLELKKNVTEEEGLVKVNNVPPLAIYGRMHSEDELGSVLDCLYRYHHLGIEGMGESLKTSLWRYDEINADKGKYITHSLNLSRWLESRHRTSCGFEELWNDSPGKVDSVKINKWRTLVLTNLRKGYPVIYCKNDEKWQLIVGFLRKEDKVYFKSDLQEDGTDVVEGKKFRDIVSECCAMYAFIPGGGRGSRKERRGRVIGNTSNLQTTW